MEKAKSNYPDEVVSAGQILRMLNSDAREISTLCQRACLKPKKDGFGNIYFSKGDVDILRKVKELYEHSKAIRQEKKAVKPENFLFEDTKNEKGAEKLFEKHALPAVNKNGMSVQNTSLAEKLETVENNIVKKLKDILSEKLDGLDEVIVELIKAKTENETLRQKVNELNKENFSLKTENSKYKPVALGFYVKKQTDDFTF